MPVRLKNGGLAALYDQNQNWGSVCVWGGRMGGWVALVLMVLSACHMALSVRISQLHLSSWPPLWAEPGCLWAPSAQRSCHPATPKVSGDSSWNSPAPPGCPPAAALPPTAAPPAPGCAALSPGEPVTLREGLCHYKVRRFTEKSIKSLEKKPHHFINTPQVSTHLKFLG